MQENINKRIESCKKDWINYLKDYPKQGQNYIANLEKFWLDKMQDLASYIKSETLKEVEGKIRALKNTIEEDLYNWDAYPNSGEQAKEVVETVLQALKVD